MSTFVDAIRKKYEKLTEYTIFETFTQKNPNRIGANILFPARTLTMDCQQISSIGNEEELIRSAGHVAELDLAGNNLSSWNEVFILLRCLRNLESLNLSQNPLGPNHPNTECSSTADNTTVDGMIADEEKDERSSDPQNNSADVREPTEVQSDPDPNGNCSTEIDVPFSSRKPSTDGSPVLRFASYEPVHRTDMCSSTLGSFPGDRFGDVQSENRENWCNGYEQPELSEEVLKSAPNVLCPPIQLAIEANLLGPSTVFPRLNVLALNATYVPWDWVLQLLHRFPNLSTLHVALNNYGAEEDRLDGSGDSFDWHSQTPIYPRLRSLYYSDNGITSWWTVCRLGRLFPGLEQLVLLGNPLSHIPTPLPTKETGAGVKPVDEVNYQLSIPNRSPAKPTPLTGKPAPSQPASASTTMHSQTSSTRSNRRLFGSLHTLGLSETTISRWESVDALGEWMPNMTNLRLGNTLPVFQSWPESECRAHVIARLPNLKTYNRSAIDSEEREAAEREFVRYYGQVEPALRPHRYWELERQHGRLEPLANIDLSPKRFVRVRVALGDKEIWHNLNLNLKVGQVKRQFASLFGIESTELKRFRLLYFDQVMALAQGPEELKFPNRAIHSYQPESGDMFELIRFPDFSRSG